MTNKLTLKSAELDVVTFGEAMMMFVATQTGDLHRVEQFVRRAAGAELNVAIGLARLELKCGWVSRLGNDFLAVLFKTHWTKNMSIAGRSPSITPTLPAFSLNLKPKMGPIPLWNISAKDQPPATSRWLILTKPILAVLVICI